MTSSLTALDSFSVWFYFILFSRSCSTCVFFSGCFASVGAFVGWGMWFFFSTPSLGSASHASFTSSCSSSTSFQTLLAPVQFSAGSSRGISGLGCWSGGRRTCLTCLHLSFALPAPPFLPPILSGSVSRSVPSVITGHIYTRRALLWVNPASWLA